MQDINNQLFSETSLNNADRPTMGYETNTDSDRGDIRAFNIKNASIGTAKIQAFNFNQGTGGTLTLGGTSNGNGVMRILNSSGAAVITADNTGITVNNGSITINNASGSASVDASGLVSQNNFQISHFFGTTSLDTSSTSFVDVTGSSLTPLVLTRDTYVLFIVMASGLNASVADGNLSDSIEVLVYDDVTGGIGNIFFYGELKTYTPDGSSFFITLSSTMRSRTFIKYLSAGTHNIKLQYRAVNGGTATLNQYSVDYVVLGT